MSMRSRVGSTMAWALLFAAASACSSGGGGSGGGGGTAGSGGSGGAPPKYYVSGTAATGLPLANVTITLKDSQGKTATAQSGSDGKFQIEVTALKAPFLLKGGGLYSAALDRGVANITQLTDLLVRNWYTHNSKTVQSDFDGTAALASPPTGDWMKRGEQVLRAVVWDYLTGAGVNPIRFHLVNTPFEANGAGFDLALQNIKVEFPAPDLLVKPVGGNALELLRMPETKDLALLDPKAGSPFPDTTPPSVPAGVTVTLLTDVGKYLIMWTASTDTSTIAGVPGAVGGYKIFHRPQSGASDAAVGLIDATFYLHAADTTAAQCYTVLAFDTAGTESAKSTEVCSTPAAVGVADTAPPAQPAPTTAAGATADKVVVSWSPLTDSDLAGIRILRGGQLVADVAGNVTSVPDNPPTTGTYSYTVSAYDQQGNVAKSAEVTGTTTADREDTLPTAPVLTATVQGRDDASSVTLTWTASTDSGNNLVGYKLFKGTTELTTVPKADPLTFTDAPGPMTGQTFRYVVIAYDDKFNTGWSNEAVASPTVAQCGNSQVESGETCDGSNLNGASCQSQGFTGGTLTCNANCTYNTSGCTGGGGVGFMSVRVALSGLTTYEGKHVSGYIGIGTREASYMPFAGSRGVVTGSVMDTMAVLNFMGTQPLQIDGQPVFLEIWIDQNNDTTCSAADDVVGLFTNLISIGMGEGSMYLIDLIGWPPQHTEVMPTDCTNFIVP